MRDITVFGYYLIYFPNKSHQFHNIMAHYDLNGRRAAFMWKEIEIFMPFWAPSFFFFFSLLLHKHGSAFVFDTSSPCLNNEHLF